MKEKQIDFLWEKSYIFGFDMYVFGSFDWEISSTNSMQNKFE